MTQSRPLILAIDDTPANLITLGSVLENEFELQIATSGPMGIALALENPPELILLDVMMPEVDGYETYRRLAAEPTLRNIPVVFVTALGDLESEVKGLSMGAADYIAKPINISIARQRIRNLIEREHLRKEVQSQRDSLQQEVVRRCQSEELVRQLAFYDALTGLANRRLLDDRLSQSLAASKRSACYGALMFLDLDNFKPLNDTHGHDVGDLLLIEVARRLTGCVREVDTVARFGGDEFVVMLGELDAQREVSLSQARQVAEKVRQSLAEPYLLQAAQEGVGKVIVEHHCSASIGVSMFNHEWLQLDILKQADAAMYQAKGGGRNRIRFFDRSASAV